METGLHVQVGLTPEAMCSAPAGSLQTALARVRERRKPGSSKAKEEAKQKENVVSESLHCRDSGEAFSPGLMLIPDGSGQVIPVHRNPRV